MEISQLRSGWCLAQYVFQVPPGRRTFSAVLSGRNLLRSVFQPLRSWLISGGHSATPLALAALVWFLAVGAAAETTNALSDAEIQGRQLAQQLCEAQPAENFTNTGVLQIRDGNGNHTNIPIRCEVIITATNWQSINTANKSDMRDTNSYSVDFVTIRCVHTADQPNQYIKEFVVQSVKRGWLVGKDGSKISDGPISIGPNLGGREILSGEGAMIPFVKSDFWLADLGLEFFHWPVQKVLPKTTNLKRGRDYTLLESTNPNPATNGYSRVLSWIDKESGGILEAEAYDAAGKLLKVFEPKSFKKINGQWELQEMEIRNVQTGSRTRLDFDLKQP
jgi:hypothetical protein